MVKLNDKVGDIQLTNQEIQHWIAAEVKKKCTSKLETLRSSGYSQGTYIPKKLPLRVKNVVKTLESFNIETVVYLSRFIPGGVERFQWDVRDASHERRARVVFWAEESEVIPVAKENIREFNRIERLVHCYSWSQAGQELRNMDLAMGLMPAMNKLADLIFNGSVNI